MLSVLGLMTCYLSHIVKLPWTFGTGRAHPPLHSHAGAAVARNCELKQRFKQVVLSEVLTVKTCEALKGCYSQKDTNRAL